MGNYIMRQDKETGKWKLDPPALLRDRLYECPMCAALVPTFFVTEHGTVWGCPCCLHAAEAWRYKDKANGAKGRR